MHIQPPGDLGRETGRAQVQTTPNKHNYDAQYIQTTDNIQNT